MTPEQKARQKIDQQLVECGWVIQNYRDMNISAGLGVAIREFPLKTGFADYLLYCNCKAIGAIEAKPEGHNLIGVETQSGKHLIGFSQDPSAHRLPLPLAYETIGIQMYFPNFLPPDYSIAGPTA